MDDGTTAFGDLLRVGRWTHDPVAATLDRDDDSDVLRVVAAEGSDAWRHTSYGFVHDSEHALLAPMETQTAVEVSFVLDYDQQFDQAGLFLRSSATEWIKAGVEVSDGVPQVGAVVTHGTSDWSVAPVRDWVGRRVTIRASRGGDAVTVRARVDDDAWQLVRVAHLDPTAEVEAGPYCAAPTREGLEVVFTGFRTTAADDSLH